MYDRKAMTKAKKQNVVCVTSSGGSFSTRVGSPMRRRDNKWVRISGTIMSPRERKRSHAPTGSSKAEQGKWWHELSTGEKVLSILGLMTVLATQRGVTGSAGSRNVHCLRQYTVR